jgi:hypothetical protein
LEKDLDVDSIVLYQLGKPQLKISHIYGYTKMTKAARNTLYSGYKK